MNHKTKLKQYESGQAIILVAVIMVGLLGMLGMAIDGGGLFFLHRDTQNAVDAAVLAATYAKCTTDPNDPDRDAKIVEAARIAASQNAFDNGLNGVEVDIIANYDKDARGPAAAGVYTPYVAVTINATKPSYFIQLVYQEPLRVTSRGVGYCIPPSANLIPNAAVVTLRPNSACSNNIGDTAFVHTGTSRLEVWNSGIFSNSSNSSCAFDRNGSGEVVVHGACTTPGGIASGIDCDSEVEGATGEKLTDLHPLSHLDPPDDACSLPAQVGSEANSPLSPGHYSVIDVKNKDVVVLEPGIYCIEKINMTGGRLEGNGVVIYMPPPASDTASARIEMHGQTEFALFAPSAPSCEDYGTCAWNGLLIWADIRHENGCPVPPGDICGGILKINGGTNTFWTGMIYAPGSGVEIEGGADGLGMNAQIVAWGFKGAGNEELDIYYERPAFLQTPPSVGYAE